jgi:adhesin transport system membrane fusion protein
MAVNGPENKDKIKEMIKKERVRDNDIEFMNSLHAAVLQKSPVKMSLLLYVIFFLLTAFFIWANLTELDELTRGQGRVIPSKQVQVVQNLEGGIIKEIRIHQGEFVKEGEVLVIIDDTGAGSSFQESVAKINELKARETRLKAEAGISKFTVDDYARKNYPNLIREEERLFNTNMKRKNNEKEVLIQRFKQKQVDLANARQKLNNLNANMKMIEREIELMEPLFKKGLVSELEYIQLKQKELESKKEIDSTGKDIESLKLQIIEARNAVEEMEGQHASEAQTVKRTMVRSPVNGTVKQLLINTVGGVVKPGMDILEIVPNDDKLLVEAKIKPSDIAFIYPGQKAVVKLTAYDFAIYGGLDGTVVLVSADTITDERDEEFYLVRIETGKNYLGTEDNKKEIMVGMTVQADIITGKKTVMQYLMKPILRAKYNALRER